MDGYLQRLIDYNNWANEGLILFLQSLPEETLDVTAPGVYWTIRQTLDHLLTAEDNYYRSLARIPRADHSLRPERPDLAALARYARESSANLEALMTALPEPADRLQFRDGKRFAATALTQLVMHGVEHRAHVGTVLGSLGTEPPALDSWAHGIFVHGDDWPPDWGEEPSTLPRFGFEL